MTPRWLRWPVRCWAGYGRLDVLVNNAGQLMMKSFEEMTLAEWDNILRVNLRGVVLGCKLFLGAMKAGGGGSIINVSSNAGVMGFALESAYCASKFGIEGFSRALAMELQPHNIAVNTVTPGKLPGGATIKPTSLTQAQFDVLSPAERARWADAAVLTEAFIFLRVAAWRRRHRPARARVRVVRADPRGRLEHRLPAVLMERPAELVMKPRLTPGGCQCLRRDEAADAYGERING